MQNSRRHLSPLTQEETQPPFLYSAAKCITFVVVSDAIAGFLSDMTTPPLSKTASSVLSPATKEMSPKVQSRVQVRTAIAG